MLRPVEPIDTLALFPPLHTELVQLLRHLPPTDWLKPTPATGWSVKDMVAHILDTDIRRLSSHRDQFVPALAHPPATYADLVALLNDLNEQWVVAARRISPALLLQLLDLIGPQVHEHFRSLDPMAIARHGVAWAGEEQSLNWFDLAREYTEKWHHQQHIRQAVGAPLLLEARWLYPALDTFLRGLPHTYRAIDAADGTTLALMITGEGGGNWALQRNTSIWQLYWGEAAAWDARVTIDGDSAWQLFTKGLAPAEARSRSVLEGDQQLGEQLFSLLAIMA
jgi:uncharacterized protein (TIGR03083 family)